MTEIIPQLEYVTIKRSEYDYLRAVVEGEKPSDETVEHVARALAKADGKDPDEPAWVEYPSGRTFGVCWRDQYAVKARAALAAINARGDNG